jgi:hypothetical protein
MSDKRLDDLIILPAEKDFLQQKRTPLTWMGRSKPGIAKITGNLESNTNVQLKVALRHSDTPRNSPSIK